MTSPAIHALTPPLSAAEAQAWSAVVAEAHTADLPDVPAPTAAEIAGRLRVPSVNSRFALWAAEGGVASLQLFTDPGNAHTAHLDALVVRPDARRRGLGQALWEQVRAELAAQGRSSVSTVLDLGGAGEAFARSRGFHNVLPLAWYVQQVPGHRVEAARTPGYELVLWDGLVPDTWAAAAASAHGVMEDAPSGDMDARPPVWTPERLHSVQQVVLDRGGRMLMAAAVTPGGEVAAYSSLVLLDPAGPRALQYDTAVVPAHRGRGLGRAVKLHMLAHAPARWPSLREIATSVADENMPMRAVNEALGYRRERAAAVFQLSL
ncbi:GNAT family N-acetyltransferase [Streptomyces sp. NPDC006326]|uniref:GNAT family N-acetyltransferase n=1 Tax=Streptomyces sp. NPDC006326 TaxID=3156752 RepID=UPI0033A1065A